jgi:Tfp pilus assembly protein PilO
VIAAYLARLNKRERLVFYGAAIFISLAFIDRLVVGPVFSKMKTLDDRIGQESELIRKNARIAAEKGRVAAVSSQMSAYSRKTGTQEEEVAYLLGEVEKLARKTSLYIVDMKPLGVSEDSVSRKYSVDLNCEAQMEQIMSFMYEVENSSVLFFVESFNITPKSSDSSIAKCNMRISSVVFL